jgi:glucan endo-1,3-alpha-glucosidase
LTAYYAYAYKTGSFPDIAKDKLVMWARTHPGSATAPDPVGKPTNFELVNTYLSSFLHQMLTFQP